MKYLHLMDFFLPRPKKVFFFHDMSYWLGLLCSTMQHLYLYFVFLYLALFSFVIVCTVSLLLPWFSDCLTLLLLALFCPIWPNISHACKLFIWPAIYDFALLFFACTDLPWFPLIFCLILVLFLFPCLFLLFLFLFQNLLEYSENTSTHDPEITAHWYAHAWSYRAWDQWALYCTPVYIVGLNLTLSCLLVRIELWTFVKHTSIRLTLNTCYWQSKRIYELELYLELDAQLSYDEEVLSNTPRMNLIADLQISKSSIGQKKKSGEAL